MSSTLLRIRNLRVAFHRRGSAVQALRGVDLDVAPGEIVGLVGESGSGKSVTGLATLGLLDSHATVQADELSLSGRSLLGLGESEMRKLRGARVAMIFQDPATTLNPVLRIDTQMVEAVRAHEAVTVGEARERCRAALERVGISDAQRRLSSYPHEFSGGMRQRVAIAIALLHKPDLIIADEPTTALDVTIQAQILDQMRQLCRESGTALLWVTHDLGVVAELANRVAVMYAGRVVEQGPTMSLLNAPSHPYTAGLIASVPARHARGELLTAMAPPGPLPAEGCAFAPRCPRVVDDCRTGAVPELPAPLQQGLRHTMRCIHPLVAA